MDFIGEKWFKFRSEFNQFELGFLNSREYGLLFVLLSALNNKGENAVNIDKRYIVKMFNSNLSYANLNSLLISLKQKLTDRGFIGNDNKAIFSVFDWTSDKKGISSVSVKLQKNRLYLFNNVKQNYTGIDLLKLNSMPCFGAKVVYCWINQYKKMGSFFIKADKLLSILGVDTSDSCNLGIKFKRMIKALHSIGYEVEIIKEKKGIDARRISALRFNFKMIKQDTTKQANPTTPTNTKATNTNSLDCLINLIYKKDDKLVRLARIDKNGAYYKAWFNYVGDKNGFFVNIKDYDYFIDYLLLNGFVKQDKSMINEIKPNQVLTPIQAKENDALIRFKNSAKTLNKDRANPTITPTIKKADNCEIKADNSDLAKYENIILTSPKYFDYKILSVIKGSLYYEIKAYCDLKKKHELIKLLVAEYSNPLDYFYKQGYKFKCYDKQESDADFSSYLYKIVSLCNNDEKYGEIVSYLKIMRIFKRYDNKIQVELKDVDKEGVMIKPFIADNSAHLNAWFNKYQFGSY